MPSELDVVLKRPAQDPAQIAEMAAIDDTAFPEDPASADCRFTKPCACGRYSLWVAVDGAGKVAGFVESELDVRARSWHVMRLAVRADCRRRGLGRNLLRASLQEAASAGLSAAYLEVAVDNPAAQALYASEGFHAVCTLPLYLPKTRLPLSRDCLCMFAKLDGYQPAPAV